MSPIAANLQAIRRRISEALQGDRRAITLVAVSKTQSADAVRQALEAGCRDFGESYVQEAIPKIAALRDAGITWHFIGRLQTNKAQEVAASFDWVHGVDRARAAAALSKARAPVRGELNVCLQVNISGEGTKGGVRPGEALALAREVAAMPSIRLRGLMGMASPTDDVGEQRAQFAVLRKTFEALVAEGFRLDTLSMGMSQDFEAALAEGATMVRIGTAIFGERPSPRPSPKGEGEHRRHT
ncbi:MAG: YggS family pyridoxal phosphate-dependent enzyme [Usitatibacter sp.]